MPKKKIESEVRPYLNLLIENGASLVWLQKFYKKNIKNKTKEAINALTADTLFEQIQLLRLFINNQAIHDKKAYEKLIAIRKLFRHSDILADNLQMELTKQILINPNQPIHSFLAQDAEKTLSSLLYLQVLLEIREEVQNLKNKNLLQDKKSIEEQEIWLKKEIHSRVPIAQRKNNHSVHFKPTSHKWNLQRVRGGYDTGPDGTWYFFHGETKFTVFFQREILKLLAHLYDFNDFITALSNGKKPSIEIMIHFIKNNLLFGLQLINLAFFPYRLLRTFMAEFNQFVFYLLRKLYEYSFPKKHCNKSLLHFASLGVQLALYLGILLNTGLPYHLIFPVLMVSPIQVLSVATLFFVLYNAAALGMSMGKFFLKQKFKKEPGNTTEKSQVLPDTSNNRSEKLNAIKKNPAYTPRLKHLLTHQSKALLKRSGNHMVLPKPQLKIKTKA